MPYRGRFAPSATGPLHLGSIFAALISYLDARFHQGLWLLRIDDLDRLRCKPAFAQAILQTLDAFALHPDGPPRYQSERLAAYQDAFDQLRTQGLLYHCDCVRKALPRGAYPGTCRTHLGEPVDVSKTVRIDSQGIDLWVNDRIQGRIETDPSGDFIVKRRDGLFAYQLACAVDESLDQISHVVRGVDLLASTPMQRLIMMHLQQQAPEYGHFGVLVDATGAKLSKQTFATPVDPTNPGGAYAQIARLLLLKDTPSPAASGAEWVAYFVTLGDPSLLLPRELALSAITNKTS